MPLGGTGRFGASGRHRGHSPSCARSVPTRDELQGLLDKIITRLLKMLTRSGHLVEEEGMTYMADMDADNPLVSLQAVSCTYRIALGPRAGQKVLSLRTVPGRDGKTAAGLCADAHGVARMQRSAIRES